MTPLALPYGEESAALLADVARMQIPAALVDILDVGGEMGCGVEESEEIGAGGD